MRSDVHRPAELIDRIVDDALPQMALRLESEASSVAGRERSAAKGSEKKRFQPRKVEEGERNVRADSHGDRIWKREGGSHVSRIFVSLNPLTRATHQPCGRRE